VSDAVETGSLAAGSHEWIMARAEQIAAAGESAPRLGRHPVNPPMVGNWVEAIGDENPVYDDPEAAAASVHGGLVAPPAMVQVWTMGGLRAKRDPDDPLYASMAMLDEAGFTSVVATNSEQTYLRYLRHGEQVSVTTRLESVVGPKRTGLGEGYFVTTKNTWYVGAEPVATMTWRILKFKPAARAEPGSGGGARSSDAAVAGSDGRASGASPDGRQGVAPGSGGAPVIRPMVNRDSEFFWEGTRKGELRIQRCGACGELRHPPGPMCPVCGATRPDYVVARGTGTVYSYAVHRHPPLPGKELPIVLALVELDEGVRMVGELLDAADDQVEIGLPVEVSLVRVDDELTLPAWRPVRGGPGVTALAVGTTLPPWEVPVTPTLVVSTAIATRDFQDVHHDRDLAVEKGSKDIFLNILTTTGLVQRYVTDALGQDVLVRSIAIRLGAPAYPYDPLRFTGRVREEVQVDDEHRFVVDVRGSNSLGDHVTGTVTVAPGREAGR
jgi:uncharacterized OB-fold protein/acyl dehydratase